MAESTRSSFSNAAARGITFLGVAAAMTSCTGSLNTSDELLDAPPLPALSGPVEAQVPASASQPSLSRTNGLDRRDWPMVEVASPRGQVEHQPTYVTTFAPDQSLARDRGEFPNKDTALQTTGDGGAEVVEAAANVGGTPLLIPAAPVQMILGRWWWITERDHPDFQRLPMVGNDLPPPSPWLWVEPVGAK